VTESVGLLDTSVMIDLLEIPVVKLPLRLLVSALTFAELTAGISDSPQRLFRHALQLSLLKRSDSVLPFDSDCAMSYKSVFEAAAAKGRKPRGGRAVDYLIATTAARYRIPLYTRNPKDFEGLEGLVEIVAV
jgi:predicted nucleic acid-binding protein